MIDPIYAFPTQNNGTIKFGKHSIEFEEIKFVFYGIKIDGIKSLMRKKSEFFSEEIFEITKLRKEANEFFKKKDFKKAIKIYREIELDLNNITYTKEEISKVEEEIIRIKMNIIVNLLEQKEYRKTIIKINEVKKFEQNIIHTPINYRFFLFVNFPSLIKYY